MAIKRSRIDKSLRRLRRRRDERRVWLGASQPGDVIDDGFIDIGVLGPLRRKVARPFDGEVEKAALFQPDGAALLVLQIEEQAEAADKAIALMPRFCAYSCRKRPTFAWRIASSRFCVGMTLPRR